jgi:hypothetical protein
MEFFNLLVGKIIQRSQPMKSTIKISLTLFFWAVNSANTFRHDFLEWPFNVEALNSMHYSRTFLHNWKEFPGLRDDSSVGQFAR